jgi:hypothetical protein
MPDQPVSRRTVAIALGGGALLAPLASIGPSEQACEDAAPAAGAQAERTLLSPLAEGARLLSWDVTAIEPLAMGAVRVRLRGDSGATFGVEIMARDRSPIASRPPAQTDRFALYVSNGGDGRSPTAEEQGLAAMALAQIVAQNEALVPVEGFMTHAERIAEHPVALLEHVDGSLLPGPLDPRAKSVPEPVARDVRQVASRAGRRSSPGA